MRVFTMYISVAVNTSYWDTFHAVLNQTLTLSVIVNPDSIYLLEVNKRNTRTRYEYVQS